MSERQPCSHHSSKDSLCSHKGCVTVVPIFSHLDDVQLKEVMSVVHPTHYQKGETIFRAGDHTSVMYIVSKGSVRLYRLGESGKEQVVRILQPGEFIGENALFNEIVHETYAETMKDTVMCQINRRDLQKLLLEYPSISLKLLKELATRVDQSEQQATRITTEPVEKRLAYYLVETLTPEDKSNEVILPMNKKDLASYLGTTPETISRKLTEFEELALIKRLSPKKIKILNVDGLLLK